ncbi:ABC transporter ATP-binding protein [Geomonas oryzae]|uniref:ABC transporter ATP-binding protein n=1 Tax=Geomonas oryzae TaxID=2364273 RepID=UPI00100B1311|nr:ABC transporter ATP-binding protein [Geomonas oryzae]
MNAMVHAEGLGKKYYLRHQKKDAYATLRDSIVEGMGRVCRLGRGGRETRDEFWALRDVSFQLQPGDRLGIIGRNGAGKSTLLKILSRITEPSEGVARIRGRVSSLLEVGTGFHPELTGRENIYLNGAILGMKRLEIKKKFDEIVAFADVERFLDTPVKRYSSGMYVRLAFSVAAHLEPDVLIVDEVLAVGDAQFQKKCLGKLEQASREEGRAVLLVSHNMAAIEALCSTALYLRNGGTKAHGPAREVIERYLGDMAVSAASEVSKRSDRSGKGMVRLTGIRPVGAAVGGSCSVGDDLRLALSVENRYGHPVSARMCLSLRSSNDIGLIVCDSYLTGETHTLAANSVTTLSCTVFAPPLNYGEYFVNVTILKDDQVEDYLPSALRFSVESGTFDNHVRQQAAFPILARFSWKVEGDEAADAP